MLLIQVEQTNTYLTVAVQLASFDTASDGIYLTRSARIEQITRAQRSARSRGLYAHRAVVISRGSVDSKDVYKRSIDQKRQIPLRLYQCVLVRDQHAPLAIPILTYAVRRAWQGMALHLRFHRP
jgi:hypothetical protein